MNAYPGNEKACDESPLHDCDVQETKVPSPYTQPVVQVSNKLVVQDVAMEEERCVAMEEERCLIEEEIPCTPCTPARHCRRNYRSRKTRLADLLL